MKRQLRHLVTAKCWMLLPSWPESWATPTFGVEHLFLAIVRDRAAVPTQALARITDLYRVEASVREEMASPGYTGEPPAGAVWLSVSELPDLLPALASCVAPGVGYGFNVVGDRAWIIVGEPGNTAATVASARAQVERKVARPGT